MVGFTDRENSSVPSAIFCILYCRMKNLFAALLLLMNKMDTAKGGRDRAGKWKQEMRGKEKRKRKKYLLTSFTPNISNIYNGITEQSVK